MYTSTAPETTAYYEVQTSFHKLMYWHCQQKKSYLKAQVYRKYKIVCVKRTMQVHTKVYR